MSEVTQLFLMTADLDHSRRFYEDGLDLEPRRVGDTSVSYETGQCELKLQADFPPDALESFNLEPPGNSRGDGVIHVVAVDDDLETAYERIEGLDDDVGVTVTEPRDVPWGERMFLAKDANGYVFEVR